MSREYNGPDSPPGTLSEFIINLIDVEQPDRIAPQSVFATHDVVETQYGSNGMRPRLNIWVQRRA